jgi:hypothetical protein
MIPYIVIRHGNLGKQKSTCDFDTSYDAILREIKINDSIYPIKIPQGSNQESIFYKVNTIINEWHKKRPNPYLPKPWLLCEGHLPIKSIRVGPTYDRERFSEQIKHYCSSKYWLQNVTVTCSNIPFIPPSE